MSDGRDISIGKNSDPEHQIFVEFLERFEEHSDLSSSSPQFAPYALRYGWKRNDTGTPIRTINCRMCSSNL